MNRRQIFSIHIVLKCQRSSEAQTFARLQYFCTFVIEIKDRMQYCMEEPKRGCRARALSNGTRLLYALRAALRAARAGVMIMTVLPLKRTPFIFFFFFFFWGGGGTMNHDITTHMEDIIDSHNWIMDIHNCTMGNRTYVCSIVDNNMWSPLWLSIIWLLIHNLKYEHPYELFKYGYP